MKCKEMYEEQWWTVKNNGEDEEKARENVGKNVASKKWKWENDTLFIGEVTEG